MNGRLPLTSGNAAVCVRYQIGVKVIKKFGLFPCQLPIEVPKGLKLYYCSNIEEPDVQTHKLSWSSSLSHWS